MNEKLLLDTHIWIWLLNGDKTLEPEIIKLISKAGKNNNVFISTISMWEVAMLEAKGRIALDCSTHDWIEQALSTPGISLISLSPDIAINSCNLPDEFHKDPADRIIVASARNKNHTLITRDERIINYSKQGYLKCIAG